MESSNQIDGREEALLKVPPCSPHTNSVNGNTVDKDRAEMRAASGEAAQLRARVAKRRAGPSLYGRRVSFPHKTSCFSSDKIVSPLPSGWRQETLYSVQ